MSDSRSTILQLIEKALASDADLCGMPASPEEDYAAIPRTYRRTGNMDREAVLELFYDRLRDYDTDLVFTTEEGIADAVLQAMQKADASLLLVPKDVPQAWLPAADGVDIVRDEQLTTAEIDRRRVVLTGCTVAVATSGTVCLEHGAEHGRRVATLLPDHHLCVIHRSQVVETLAEAVTRITDRTLPITTIAGPSATSDIEMTRIRGVHGPRYLTAILYG